MPTSEPVGSVVGRWPIPDDHVTLYRLDLEPRAREKFALVFGTVENVFPRIVASDFRFKAFFDVDKCLYVHQSLRLRGFPVVPYNVVAEMANVMDPDFTYYPITDDQRLIMEISAAFARVRHRSAELAAATQATYDASIPDLERVSVAELNLESAMESLADLGFDHRAADLYSSLHAQRVLHPRDMIDFIRVMDVP